MILPYSDWGSWKNSEGTPLPLYNAAVGRVNRQPFKLQKETFMDNPSALIKELNQTYGLQLAEQLSADQLEAVLAEQFNTMIQKDFSALVQFLYRTDISETRLRALLEAAAGEEAGRIIARLVIERLYQKIQTRQQYKDMPGKEPPSDEERW